MSALRMSPQLRLASVPKQQHLFPQTDNLKQTPSHDAQNKLIVLRKAFDKTKNYFLICESDLHLIF